MRKLAILGAAAALWCAASAASAASFDCNKARTADEKAICANRTLNDKDVKLATLYDVIRPMLAMGGRGAVQDAQIAWLRARGACRADVACLNRSYDQRIAELNRELKRIYSRGPF